MMMPQYERSPATGMGEASPIKTIACEHCGRALPAQVRGRAGRVRRFCSSRCQKAEKREKAAFERAGYNLPWCPKIDAKSPSKSNGCKAKNGHPHPPGLSVPIDLLGRGHRWPRTPKLDAETRAKILLREVGAP
jgi:endogenous inhibitor of DNA gyrase (YacG/DUF329 family)